MTFGPRPAMENVRPIFDSGSERIGTHLLDDLLETVQEVPFLLVHTYGHGPNVSVKQTDNV